MHEVFPIVAGCVVALLVQRLSAPGWKTIALVVLSALFGAIASFISGELFIDWSFLVFDTILVLLAAVAMTLLVAWWQRRPVQPR